MTRLELDRYISERNRLNTKINQALENATIERLKGCKVTPVYSDMPKGGQSSDKVQNAVELADKYTQEANLLIDKLNSLKEPVRAFINDLPKLSQRKVMYYRYISESYGKTKICWSWRDIGRIMGLSKDGCKKIHEKIILQHMV